MEQQKGPPTTHPHFRDFWIWKWLGVTKWTRPISLTDFFGIFEKIDFFSIENPHFAKSIIIPPARIPRKKFVPPSFWRFLSKERKSALVPSSGSWSDCTELAMSFGEYLQENNFYYNFRPIGTQKRRFYDHFLAFLSVPKGI